MGFTALDIDRHRIPVVDDGKSGVDLPVATGTSDIGKSRYPALGFDEFGLGGFAEEVEGEGRPQQKCLEF